MAAVRRARGGAITGDSKKVPGGGEGHRDAGVKGDCVGMSEAARVTELCAPTADQALRQHKLRDHSMAVSQADQKHQRSVLKLSPCQSASRSVSQPVKAGASQAEVLGHAPLHIAAKEKQNLEYNFWKCESSTAENCGQVLW
ncbi:hypothetical protein E2C01_076066 [Portunus trituberculatus]|uniref:Uncharacterized protein n=1 Tax=Portunus trituberculatus TaxID=210409 RepID=A0A5B7IAF7_PORTR|nr:hypothetical protein [Portunus trituberculatus]